jgi:hypothetical protein
MEGYFLRNKFIVVILFVFLINLTWHSEADASTLSDYIDFDATAYYAEPMTWAVDRGLMNGYPTEKKLKPFHTLTEAQFLTMLFRYLSPEEDLSPTYKKHWAYKQYGLVEKYNLSSPSTYKNLSKADKGIRRGDVATLLAQAITGQAVTEKQAVEWLYTHNISNGYPDSTGAYPKTYETYLPNDTLKRAQIVTFLYGVEKSSLPKIIQTVKRTFTNEGSTFTSPEGIQFVSKTSNWKADKLKDLYFELLNNQHGKELSVLGKVVVSPEKPPGLAGNFEASWTIDSAGKMALEPNRPINLFNANEKKTVLEMANTLSHEYGHLFTYYWLIAKEQKAPTNAKIKWASIRGLSGLPVRWDGSKLAFSHYWQAEEIMADDYAVLLGSKTPKRMLKPILPDIPVNGGAISYIDNSYPSAIENQQVRAAWAVPGLRDYFINLSGLQAGAAPALKKPVITGITYEETIVQGWTKENINVKIGNTNHTNTRKIQYFVEISTRNSPYGGFVDGQSSIQENTNIISYAHGVNPDGSLNYKEMIWIPEGKASVRVYAFDPITCQLIYSDEQWYDFTNKKAIKPITSQFKLN